VVTELSVSNVRGRLSHSAIGYRPNQRTKTKSKAIHKIRPVLVAYFLVSIAGDSPEDAPRVVALIVKFSDIFVA
jgi:hypothetical protein